MNIPLVGRKEEQKILQSALNSPKAEMVSVIGRRRVGKTFLVNTVYQGKIDFEITGVQYASREEQLQNFMIQLSKYSQGSFPLAMPKNWIEAFHFLSKMLEMKRKDEKMVVFLDELPWLATRKSGFLKGLSWFWNSWAVHQKIVLVICGSAASWMIKKVVHHKGGLHNRITKRLSLKPFTLAETEAFLQAKNIRFERYQILHLYMAMGGVPHYLDEIEGGKSAAQNINRICFSENGLLYDEFSKLYSSLFEESKSHIKIIRALAEKRKGLTRSEIISHTRLPEGGGTSEVLEELIHSGFVSMYYPFGKKKKDSLYRLTDEYSLFYIRFIEKNRSEERGLWEQLSQTQTYTSWAGYAFESICLKHVYNIKKALQILGIYSNASGFYKKGNADEGGVQIDLLIDRSDHVINLCEIKFYTDQYTLNKATANELRQKITRFKIATNTKKQVFLTLVTTFGTVQNQYSIGLVDSAVSLEELFGE